MKFHIPFLILAVLDYDISDAHTKSEFLILVISARFNTQKSPIRKHGMSLVFVDTIQK
jgi:hypothetical protein